MYIMYVDESGDPGWPGTPECRTGGPSPHFALAGYIIPVKHWHVHLARIHAFRADLRVRFGIPVQDEIKAAQLIHPSRTRLSQTLRKADGIRIYREALTMLASLDETAVLAEYIDKGARLLNHQAEPLPDLEGEIWMTLLDRFDRFLCNSNEAWGLVISDQTNEVRIRRFLRRLRRERSRSGDIDTSVAASGFRIVEDPVMRDSKYSTFIQCADWIVHALYQQHARKGSLRALHADRLFDVLGPVLIKNEPGNNSP